MIFSNKYKANCHGNTLGVDLWFNDFLDSGITNSVGVAKDKEFKEMMDKLVTRE